MVTFKVICQNGADFLAHYLSELSNGGWFVFTRRSMKCGDAVLVSLRIGSRSTPLFLRASVKATRRGTLSPKIRSGVAVEFLPSESRTRDYLLSLARREGMTTAARRHPRLPVDLPIRWSVRGAHHGGSGVLRNISVGGANFHPDRESARTELVEGAEVFLPVRPPGAEIEMEVLARVVWAGEDGSIGLSWRARDTGGTRRIKELVRRMERWNDKRDGHNIVTLASTAWALPL